MRIALIFAIFAPIRLCSFGNDDPAIWVFEDTWRDTGQRQDASATVLSPVDNTLVEPGDVGQLVGQADFVGAFPEDITVQWFAPDAVDAVCEGSLSADATHTCLFTVPETWQPGLHRMRFTAQAPWGQTENAFVHLVIEAEVIEPDGPPALVIRSPAPSSTWIQTDPVFFDVSLLAGTVPLVDERVVWEIDGLQISALTGRTDERGVTTGVSPFAVGPHEALVSVIVNDELLTASTRFVVTEDLDPDPDSDSDSTGTAEL